MLGAWRQRPRTRRGMHVYHASVYDVCCRGRPMHALLRRREGRSRIPEILTPRRAAGAGTVCTYGRHPGCRVLRTSLPRNGSTSPRQKTASHPAGGACLGRVAHGAIAASNRCRAADARSWSQSVLVHGCSTFSSTTPPRRQRGWAAARDHHERWRGRTTSDPSAGSLGWTPFQTVIQ